MEEYDARVLNKFKKKCNEFGIFAKANIMNLETPKDLLNYMTNDITYGFISKDNHKYTDPFSKDWQDNWYDKCLVQTGKEVLGTKIGTCWDQVELERLWFKSHHYNFKTIFMWFEINKENNLPTHTCLIYEQDNKYYWFENAFEANRGICEFNSFKEAVDYIKQEQLNYIVANNLGGKDYLDFLKVYEYDELTKPLSVQEYLDHVTKKVI